VKTVRACSLLLAAILLVVVSTAKAQTTNATVNGLVTDTSGAVIVGATVQAINDGTNVVYATTTNNEGIYSLPGLPPGRYHIQVSKTGFKTLIKPDIVLNVQDARAINFTLPVGAASETVTVEGGAPLVNTQDAAVSTVVDRQFVENIPLNGRSFQSLITLTPGVILTSPASTGGQFSVNGQRANSNYFTVDGVSANFGMTPALNTTSPAVVGAAPGFNVLGGTSNLVSVDALQEFRIQTSSMAPEFGRTPGAQVSIVTRSGTSEFHGNLFDYFRNDVLDANDWFANQKGLARPPERQNDFGGVFGGPLIRNKTFFFFSYEGLRLRLPQVASTDVPSLTTRQQTAPAQLRPFLAAFPLPNGAPTAPGLSALTASYSNPSTLDAASIRLDHTLGQKLTLFGRYAYAPSETVARDTSSLSSLQSTSITTHTLTLGATWIVAPTINDELRFAYSWTRAGTTFALDHFGGAVPPPDSTLFPSFASHNNSLYVLQLAFGALPGFDVGRDAENFQRQFNAVNNLSFSARSHALKFGIDYRRLSPTLGPFQYSQFIEFDSISSISSATADFVQIQSVRGGQLISNSFSFFGQDTWMASPRLTLTYGLRWEVNPPVSFSSNPSPVSLAGISSPSTLSLAPLGTRLYATTYDNFAPRFGLAYQISRRAGWETVLRGGTGIFYDLGTGQSGAVFRGYPFSAATVSFGVMYPLSAANSAAPPLPDPTKPVFPIRNLVFGFDPNLQLPRTYQWNVALEQSLGSHQTLTASYVAAVGRRLLRTKLLANPNSSFASVLLVNNGATSDYHALQLEFQRRLSRGLQALASYTWSHSIDDTSSEFADVSQARGPSDFDVRHGFSAAVTYDIPAPTKSRITGALLRDWGVDVITRAQSSSPVNVIARQNVFVSGLLLSVRPDLVTGVPLYLSDPTIPGGRRINAAAFVQPPTGPPPARIPLREGTLGRNALRGFPLYQTDLSLRGKVKLTERISLLVRGDLFNLFNHPNFANPNGLLFSSGTVKNPKFGVAQTMFGRGLFVNVAAGSFNPLYQVGGPRSTQLSLKLQF